VSRDFLHQIFPLTIFPRAADNSHKAISNILGNFQRYFTTNTGIKDSSGHIFSEIYIDQGNTGGKFSTSASDASGKFACQCQ
jgi:hypothetical protein